MDQLLRAHLQTCFAAFNTVSDVRPATTAARASGDWRFFERLNDPKKTFTVKKYEDTIEWFSRNWPEQLTWPSGVPRPLSFSETASS